MSSKEDITRGVSTTAASSSTQAPVGKSYIDESVIAAAAKRYAAPSSAGSSPMIVPGATPGASSTPTGTPGKIIDTFFRDKHGRFCCHHCMCGIEEDEPLFMRNDFPYCSVTCRDKGVSAKFQKLMREYNVGLASNLSVATEEENPSVGVTGMLKGYGKQMVNGLMDRVTDTIWGQEMVRTYSQTLITSKRKARHSSMAFLLEYFPDMNHYLPSDDSFSNFSEYDTHGTASNSASAGDVSRRGVNSPSEVKSPSLEKAVGAESSAQGSVAGSNDKFNSREDHERESQSNDKNNSIDKRDAQSNGSVSKESSERFGADY